MWRLAVALAMLVVGCGEGPGSIGGDDRAAIEAAYDERVRDALRSTRRDLAELSTAMDSVLSPMPLLTGAQTSALRRYLNAQHLARARALGIRPGADSARLAALREQGRLVELEDSTEHWVIRKLDYSSPLVTPDTRALLRDIGERFHERLEDLGLPPFRIELTSLLRRAEDQAALRRVNPNAAGGTSAHEFGTTVDIAYNAFAAPAELPIEVAEQAPDWLEQHLEEVIVGVLETLAARRSRELQAVLGEVLLELQREGKVLVTLERQQPVFHVTVGARY